VYKKRRIINSCNFGLAIKCLHGVGAASEIKNEANVEMIKIMEEEEEETKNNVRESKVTLRLDKLVL